MQPEALAEQGIKESLEALDGLAAVAVPVKKALKDGKLNKDDLPHALELVSNGKVILDGILGANKILPEAKDYSTAELAVIGAKALEVLKLIKEA